METKRSLMYVYKLICLKMIIEPTKEANWVLSRDSELFHSYTVTTKHDSIKGTSRGTRQYDQL